MLFPFLRRHSPFLFPHHQECFPIDTDRKLSIFSFYLRKNWASIKYIEWAEMLSIESRIILRRELSINIWSYMETNKH